MIKTNYKRGKRVVSVDVKHHVYLSKPSVVRRAGRQTELNEHGSDVAKLGTCSDLSRALTFMHTSVLQIRQDML